MTTPRPITILIAALGGEGGGVLTHWIVSAAAAQGFPVQSTSIPGVAQRTGATTYYIEIMPLRWEELAGRRPVLALTPGAGDVDVLVASELLEAGRQVAAGFVTRERTLAIASTSRSHTIAEKMTMGDGRYDSSRLIAAIERHAKRYVLFDMAAVARESGAMINAVMLGAIAAADCLPITREGFEEAIRADGRAVEANLRGFRAGFEAASRAGSVTLENAHGRRHGDNHAVAALEADARATMPASALETIIEGLRRTAAFQDPAYAKLYLDRLKVIRDADQRANAGGGLLRETARHLAVRMTFEDVIRVAEAKIAPERFARIAAELGVKDEPFKIVDFLKPGVEEICQILPAPLARGILAAAARAGWLGRLHWGMAIESTSLTGYLRFWLLSKLRRFRPKSYRYQQEQAAIDQWLGLVVEAARASADMALEIVECARLLKGYGDTWKRGVTHYQTIEARVIRPALAGRIPLPQAVDAIASARTAALIDPEGESLATCLAEIENRMALPMAAE